MNDKNLVLTLGGRRLLKGLLLIILGLLVLNITTHVLLQLAESRLTEVLAHRFGMNNELSIPTAFAILLIALNAVLLGVITWVERRRSTPWNSYWLVLTCLFWVLCLDEAAALHETLTSPMRQWLGVSGLFYFAWIIPALLGLAVLGIVYLRFLWALPRMIAIRFLIAGVVYILGAIGMEMPGGLLAERHGLQHSGFLWLTMVEESLEMLGMALFAAALVDYIDGYLTPITVKINAREDLSSSQDAA